MTSDYIESARTVIEFIEDLISKEKDIEKRYALLAARDHMVKANRYLMIDEFDKAMPHLEKARKALKEAASFETVRAVLLEASA